MQRNFMLVERHMSVCVYTYVFTFISYKDTARHHVVSEECQQNVWYGSSVSPSYGSSLTSFKPAECRHRHRLVLTSSASNLGTTPVSQLRIWFASSLSRISQWGALDCWGWGEKTVWRLCATGSSWQLRKGRWQATEVPVRSQQLSQTVTLGLCFLNREGTPAG